MPEPRLIPICICQRSDAAARTIFKAGVLQVGNRRLQEANLGVTRRLDCNPREIGQADVARERHLARVDAEDLFAAGEIGLRYAAVCVVDNHANGIGEVELTLAEVEANRAAKKT